MNLLQLEKYVGLPKIDTRKGCHRNCTETGFQDCKLDRYWPNFPGLKLIKIDRSGDRSNIGQRLRDPCKNWRLGASTVGVFYFKKQTHWAVKMDCIILLWEILKSHIYIKQLGIFKFTFAIKGQTKTVKFVLKDTGCEKSNAQNLCKKT